MKKILTLFAAALIAASSFAGDLKIGINDTSQKNAPVFVTDADWKQYHNQTIYLADELTALIGQQITKITYYAKASSSKPSSAFTNVQISLMEVSNEAFSYSDDFISTASAQVVYTGSINANTDVTFELEFSEAYVYKGGNLLVDVQKTQVNGGGYSSSWKGFQATSKTTYLVLADKGTASGMNTSGTASMNRPDVTFTYEEAPTSSCAEISSVDKSDVTAHEATLTWTSDATSFQFVLVAKGETPDWDGVAEQAVKTVTIDTLKAETEYDFYVRSYCDTESQGIASKLGFKTTPSCYAPTMLDVPEETITINSAVVTWHASGKGETQWQYTYEVWDDEVPNWDDAELTDKLSVTLTGLSPKTAYQVWVRSYCDTDDHSAAETKFFATIPDCKVQPLTFEFGFEAAEEDEFDCWTIVNGATTSYYGNTGRSTVAKRTGDYGFTFIYSENPPQYLITPELATSENQVQVEFYYRKGGTFDETFHVGYSKTTKAVDAFTFGDEQIASTSEWNLYSEKLPAGTKYVAIKYTSNDLFRLEIDDFSVTEVSPATAIDNTTVNTKGTKRIENGMLLIENNGVLYNAQGARVSK